MTIPPEMIEATARALIECMGPLFGSPEYLADPVKLARAEKRRADGARTYALAAIRTLAPMMAERFERIARANQYSPAPYCDTLKAIRALAKEMADG